MMDVVCHNLMRYSLFIILFTMTSFRGSAQSLDKYADQLYFGMLSYNPDTSIKGFITKYAPIVYKKFDSGGTWTMYPPNFTEPEHILVTNNYIFHTHPYFKEKFKLGQLAITQKIYKEP